MDLKQLWVLLAELHDEIENLKLKVDWLNHHLSPPYSEDDSQIISRGQPPDPYAEPMDHNGRPGAAERREREQRRRENIKQSRRSGSHIRQVRGQMEARIADLERKGMHKEAKALRAELRDCVDTGNKGLEWVADHIDMERGRLCVGKVRGGDTEFDIFLRMDFGPPSIEFGIGIEF